MINGMRVRFTFDFREKLTLPIHYNQLLQAFIYTNILDKELQVKYHDRGFVTTDGKHIKMFTFSRIFGKYTLEPNNRSITFFPPVRLTVSSVGSDFLSDFTEEVLRSNLLYLNGTKLLVKTFEPLSFKGEKEKVQIEMISPLTVYKTMTTNGKRHTMYFSPWDEEFTELIQKNMMSKISALDRSSDATNVNLSVKPMMERDERFQKIINFKDTVIKSWLGSYQLIGSEEMIQMAYYGGIGAKNSEGFGCFRIFGTGE